MYESVFLAVVGLGLVGSLFTGARVLKEYERAVIFRMGRARKRLAGPGLTLLLPFGIDRPRIIDTRTKAIQIPPQDVITRDNISIGVDAVVYATVASPQHAILEVEEYMPATLQLAATTLRAVLGKMELDDILAHRDAINNEVRGILDTRTEQWGVEISAVEIKDIQLPKEMQRAMARQAEAERERRAKVIAAEGEVQAAEKLALAAATISQHPGALQLRLYQTLVEVSGEASSTIVFPVPIDLLGTGGGAPAGAGASAAGANPQALASMQAMMQSATALAAQSEARAQLAAARQEAGGGGASNALGESSEALGRR
jgi:regulator of protease activity HflC (stomatin/prohibitin superfamily)